MGEVNAAVSRAAGVAGGRPGLGAGMRRAGRAAAPTTLLTFGPEL